MTNPTYVEHPSLTSYWDGARLLPEPGAAAASDTVWLPSAGDAETWEGLLAVPAGENRWTLCAVPAFAYDINFGDVVSTILSGEGAPVVTGIVTAGDHWTFRLFLESPTEGEVLQRAAEFAQGGCLVDCLSEQLIAISCPQELAQKIADQLYHMETTGPYVYETGRS